MKSSGEEYRLIWKHRTGFARMAMQHGYDIIPFAAIGADDALSIRYDSKTFQRSLAGRLARRSGLLDRFFRGGDTVMPMATGVAGTPLPRPEKMYFRFGERIPTRHLQAAAPMARGGAGSIWRNAKAARRATARPQRPH